MYTAYKYLFYQVYLWNKEIVKKSEQPVLNAFLAVSLLCYINIVNISLLFELLFNFKILDFQIFQAFYWIGIIVCVILLNYFLLLHNGRHKKIINYYKNIVGNKSRKGAILYCVLSILVLIVLVIYITATNSNYPDVVSIRVGTLA